MKYLGRGFSYSLEKKPPVDGVSPTDSFLFHRKKGHCEYFASAMTLLLRKAGIAARMVNGFAEGEWNELGKYLIIKEKHAHSWVEAYIPNTGWIVYDPTPPDLSGSLKSSSSIAFLWMDLLQLYWQRYVVRYSFQDQIKIFNFFNAERRGLIDSFKNFDFKKLMSGKINLIPWLYLLAFFAVSSATYYYFRYMTS